MHAYVIVTELLYLDAVAPRRDYSRGTIASISVEFTVKGWGVDSEGN